MRHSIFILCILSTYNLLGQITDVETLTGLTYGQHQVGFQFLKHYDPTRSGFTEQSAKTKRIVPIYLWYPAKPNKAERESKSLTFKDYVNYWGQETDYSTSPKNSKQKALENYKNTFFWLTDLSNFEKLSKVELQTKAEDGLQLKNGKFPLVILVHNSIINWHFIGEYLASHGFVVAYAPVAGTFNKRLEEDITGVETELRDIEFIIGQLSNMPEVATDNIAIVAHSLGTLAAVGLASKNNSIKAIVSLDGVIGTPNEGEIIYQMPYFDNHRFTTPLIHIHGGLDFTSDLSRIDQLQFSDRYILEIPGMRHTDFVGNGLYDTLGIKMAGNRIGNYRNGFQLANTYTLAFLNAKLKNIRSQFDELFDQSDDKPFHIRKRKETKDYEYPELIRLVFDQDFEALFDIYDRHKHLKIKAFSYATFHDVGMHLYFRAHYEAALQWFEYFSESYPNSFKAKYLLGNVLRRLGKNDMALPVLERAQELLDDDEHLTFGQKNLYANRLEGILEGLYKN